MRGASGVAALLVRPFKKAMNGTAAKGAVDQLVESVPAVGLRLNLGGGAQVLGVG